MSLFDGWFVRKANPDAERNHLNKILQDIKEQLLAAIAGGVNTVQPGVGIDVDSTDSNNPVVSVEASIIDGAADGATALQPGDNVSELVNDAGYTTNTGTVESVNNGNGVTVDNTDPINPVVNHADTSSVSDITSDNSSGVVLQDLSFSFDEFGHVVSSSAGTVDLDLRYDSLGSAAVAYASSTDFTALAIDALTPESLGFASGYDLTTGNRLTDVDAVFGSHPMFFSAASTATGLPVALSGQGVFIPFSSTAGMMFYTSASATDANRRVFYRQGSGSAWGTWIELGFRYWNAVSAASGSFTPNLDLNDAVIRTGLTVNPTISNPTGTKRNGRVLWVRLRDNGTPRTIGWGTEYRSMTATLPTTTTANKTLYCMFVVNADENTLDLMNVQVQP
jgi:hypothetical protein